MGLMGLGWSGVSNPYGFERTGTRAVNGAFG